MTDQMQATPLELEISSVMGEYMRSTANREEKIAAASKLLRLIMTDISNYSVTAPLPVMPAPKADYAPYTRQLLVELGLPTHILGHSYMITAIEKIIENPDYAAQITKKLYPVVAKIHNTTPSRVERALRHAIEVAWDRCNPDDIKFFFGNTISITKGKPTNSEFITRAAQIIQERMQEVV